jgi:arylsulfatase A-like enzyme
MISVMQRREFMKGAAVAAATLAAPDMVRAGYNRPNVLLILVDSMRTDRWTPLLETPNLDMLAKRGVSFTNHFVSATPCSPSRACLFTGTYTTQNGMYLNCDFTEGDRQPALDTRLTTLGHMFQASGYDTPFRGKWHLSRGSDRRWKRDKLADYGFTGWKPPDSLFGGPPYSGALQDPVYTRQAVDWLSDPNNHQRPWFLTLSLVNPHDVASFPRFYPQRKLRPILTEEPPANWQDDLTGKPGAQLEYRELYTKLGGRIDPNDAEAWRRCLDYFMFCIEDMDANLGRVLTALEKSGARDKTIVIFTSDHGEMAGSHGLRGKDTFVYEEKMNVPLIISAPGMIPRGLTTDAMASNVDVMPTLLSLAGINQGLPYMAGRDLKPALEDPETSVRDEVILHHDSEIRTITTIGDKAPSNFKHPTHIRCLRDRNWKYAYYFRPGTDHMEFELYNLKDDPLEMTNLANDQGYKARRKQMHERLLAKERRLKQEFSL